MWEACCHFKPRGGFLEKVIFEQKLEESDVGSPADI